VTTGTVAVACFWLIPAAGLEGAAMALVIGSSIRVGGGLAVAWHAQRALHKHSTTSEPQTPTYQSESKPYSSSIIQSLPAEVHQEISNER
jgi:hypothetical protein